MKNNIRYIGTAVVLTTVLPLCLAAFAGSRPDMLIFGILFLVLNRLRLLSWESPQGRISVPAGFCRCFWQPFLSAVHGWLRNGERRISCFTELPTWP